MLLAPDGDEIEIATAAAGFLAAEMPVERLHARDAADIDSALRARFGEMGWFALALPEMDGGSGLSAVEHALFFREVGRQCGSLDVLAQTLATLTAADPELRAGLASGETGVALAVRDGERLRLLGGPDAVYAAHVAPEAAQLVSLAGRNPEPRPALDPVNTMRLVNGPSGTLAAELGGPEVWRMGQLGTAAMLVGLAEAALDQIVEYAKVRETFGRKIGAYQAVRHACADMAVRAEAARCQLWYAAAAMKAGRADAAIHLDAAKHLANQAALANADANIQLHGGIGVTDEHHAHLYLKHALTLSKLFGARRTLLARLLEARVEA